MTSENQRILSASPYPTADQIEAIFTKVETPEELNNLRGLFAGTFHGVVTGHDHAFAGEHHGYDSWFEQLGSILDSLEQKTFKLDILHVIGGGSSPWACMEAKATAKRKTRKDYSNEFVWVMHFNKEGKIDTARAYYDSAHMEGLAKEMKAQQ